MPGLLIVSHAPLASALRAVVGHVFPDRLSRVAALDVLPDWSPEQVETAAREALDHVRDPQALILVDVFGATPCNAVQKLADGIQVRLVTGVNVPMLWRVICYADQPLETLVACAVAGGAQGVMQAVAPRPQNQSLHSRTHDQDHAHYQQ